jgi:hypothetical protein
VTSGAVLANELILRLHGWWISLIGVEVFLRPFPRLGGALRRCCLDQMCWPSRMFARRRLRHQGGAEKRGREDHEPECHLYLPHAISHTFAP